MRGQDTGRRIGQAQHWIPHVFHQQQPQRFQDRKQNTECMKRGFTPDDERELHFEQSMQLTKPIFLQNCSGGMAVDTIGNKRNIQEKEIAL
jgi:hypothetical protein